MNNELETIQHYKMNNLNFLLVDILYRKPHLHFEIELAFVLEGTGIVRTEDKAYDIRAGQAIVFNSCQVHEFSSDSSLKLLILQFNTSIFELIFPQLNEIYFESNPFNLIDNQTMFSFIMQAALTYFDETTLSPLLIHGYVSLSLDQLIHLCDFKTLNTAQQNKQIDLQERIERITKYIHENYTEKIYLDDLASREGFSRTYFSHFFKNNFGVTFKEYLDYLRCEKARVLLISTNENLLNISYACGFSDIRTLNNSFKKIYGSSPREYRKNTMSSTNDLNISFNPDLTDNQTFYDANQSYHYLKKYQDEHASD
ncbi:helix-turn-helix domain-containing protein [Lactococcus hircilactis]|uniref:Helix-turn-helix domain-containing protein n=1 Tax=Lactococcus hircilactis TaxID=1494462 RepID=A0A7X1Z8A8_9LACT|nr:AraC family transcriptional regulator [Lactococcus hircilactis]MQW38596.1 helix-turn-helix domain-containing protein [Lactococcus hircilactis]